MSLPPQAPNEVPANPNIAPKRYSPFWFRALEILPGACVWTSLLMPFILAAFLPHLVTLFVIAFDVYWLISAYNYAFLLIVGYFRLRHNLRLDWNGQLALLHAMTDEERAAEGFIDWIDINHAVILTTYKESEETLETSISSIVHAVYPRERMILVLATEERDDPEAQEIAKRLSERHKEHFRAILTTIHPDGIVGEVKAKGANAAWAARQLTAYAREEGIPLDRVVVSTADGDSRFHPKYFQCLAYHYAVLSDRTHCAFQPISMYFNNIWELPIFSRLMAFGSTFWLLVESTRLYRLVTFATHAMSLETLVEIDYWCVSVVNEDSRQFFRAYFHYKGKFRSVPLYIPVYMDGVYAGKISQSAHNLFLQQQRWAYGVEHFPYIVLEGARSHKIPVMDRVLLIYRAFLSSYSWATSSFYTTVVGWIPIVLNNSFRNQVVAANFSTVTRTLLSFTWVGLLLSAAISIAILPPPPKNYSKIRLVVTMTVQWIFVPVTAIFFGTIPGLISITRLMLGKYLGFRVTPKVKSDHNTHEGLKPAQSV